MIQEGLSVPDTTQSIHLELKELTNHTEGILWVSISLVNHSVETREALEDPDQADFYDSSLLYKI